MKFIYPEYGTERIRKVFAWWPKDIERTRVWLEHYWVKEYYGYRNWHIREISLTEIKEDPDKVKAKNVRTLKDYLGIK